MSEAFLLETEAFLLEAEAFPLFGGEEKLVFQIFRIIFLLDSETFILEAEATLLELEEDSFIAWGESRFPLMRMDGFDLNAETLASIFGFADNILLEVFGLLESFFLLMGEEGGRRLKLSISSGN